MQGPDASFTVKVRAEMPGAFLATLSPPPTRWSQPRLAKKSLRAARHARLAS